MDPDLALSMLLASARKLVDSPDPEVQSLAEQVLDLDAWVTRGAFLPRRWSHRNEAFTSANVLRYRGVLYREIK